MDRRLGRSPVAIVQRGFVWPKRPARRRGLIHAAGMRASVRNHGLRCLRLDILQDARTRDRVAALALQARPHAKGGTRLPSHISYSQCQTAPSPPRRVCTRLASEDEGFILQSLFVVNIKVLSVVNLISRVHARVSISVSERGDGKCLREPPSAPLPIARASGSYRSSPFALDVQHFRNT
jgi:hypothetical protein